MAALCDSPVVEVGKFDWTVTDVLDGRNENPPYVFGRLSKYAKQGHVTLVDEKLKSQIDALAENLLEASSPFIYLPEFSGLAFLHVWNNIQEDVFTRRFEAIIEAAYNNFFVKCEVEPVTDYKVFAQKLRTIDTFTEISAKVYPPNPLFGRLWGDLNSYVKKRNASNVTVKETSSISQGINTNIINLVVNVLQNPKYQPENPPDITDAAILMAADGYGKGTVTGFENGHEIVIKTSDNHKSFLFDKTPTPEALLEKAIKEFQKISTERDMEH